MYKKNEEELTKLLSNIVDGLRGTVDNQKEFVKLLNKIVRLIEFLIKSTAIIFFILTSLIWRMFLWNPFNTLLDKITEKWSLLTEAYQVLILGFIGAIIAGIVSYIIGSLFLEKIKNILQK